MPNRRLKVKEVKFTEKGFMEALNLSRMNALGIKGIRINGRFLVPLEDIEQITVCYNVLVDDNEFEIKN